VLPAVVILQGWHFRGVLDGYLGGEGIWANSTVRPPWHSRIPCSRNPRSSRSAA
jgi:hypothetical protein